MKRLLMIVCAFAVTAAVAQKKPKINQAEAAWKEGNFEEAKAIVDEGIKHPKTLDDDKTWFIRGLVYASMDTAGMAGGDLAEAIKSFEKATELKGGENIITGDFGFLPQSMVLQQYWAYYLNKGVNEFQSDNAEGAIELFGKSSMIMPDSVAAYYYAGLAALTINKNDIALNNFNIYIEKDGDEVDAYIRAIYVLNAIKKENEKALELAQKAKVKFPDSKEIRDMEFRILFALDRVDEAIENLETSIKQDPTNPELYFNLGVLKDQLERYDESAEHYKAALVADPTYYGAAFNLGVIYRNKLVDMSQEKNDLGISKADQAKAKELDTQIAEVAKEALPHWLKADELKPNDQTVLETLQYIYVQLKDYDKAEEIANKMDELGFEK